MEIGFLLRSVYDFYIQVISSTHNNSFSMDFLNANNLQFYF